MYLQIRTYAENFVKKCENESHALRGKFVGKIQNIDDFGAQPQAGSGGMSAHTTQVY